MVVTPAEGPPQQVVPENWAAIWNDKELENARSYRVDFELYDNPAQVDIYLGLDTPDLACSKWKR